MEEWKEGSIWYLHVAPEDRNFCQKDKKEIINNNNYEWGWQGQSSKAEALHTY